MTGAVLAELRRALNLTMADVARELHVDLAYVYRLEVGQKPLSSEMALRLRRAIADAFVARAARTAEALRNGPVARPVALRRG